MPSGLAGIAKKQAEESGLAEEPPADVDVKGGETSGDPMDKYKNNDDDPFGIGGSDDPDADVKSDTTGDIGPDVEVDPMDKYKKNDDDPFGIGGP